MSQALEYDSTISNQPIAPNAKRLLFAGFFAIFAAGIGFAIRGQLVDIWGPLYNFNALQLGKIGGAGLTGFCFGIIIGGLVADKLGYGRLVMAAFLLHVLSAVVALIVPDGASTDTAYMYLYWGTFLFAVANGVLEGVANPLVATLFPHNRTHFLNILHASWPAGMIAGGFLGWLMSDKFHVGAADPRTAWKWQLGLFLIPTVMYGLLFLGQRMPKSEAAEKKLKFSEMFKDVGILGALVACFLLSLFISGGVLQPLLVKPDASQADVESAAKLAQMIGYCVSGALLIVVAILTRFSIGSFLLFVLFVAHALIGSVELGTDGWIQNITGNLFGKEEGKWLFIYASALMFLLRFCAHFIEKKVGLSPVGILLVCSITACVGLNLISMATSLWVAVIAVGIYALGKTFFWPTMLAVASDRFPRTGAIAISIMGGIGMMSAGMLGGPGLGFSKDKFAAEDLKAKQPAVYSDYKGPKESEFLGVTTVGLEGRKLGAARDAVANNKATPAEQAVVDATRVGDRMTLRVDSLIPATMAAIYLLLLGYFKLIGGYKAVHLAGTHGDPHVT